LFPKTSYPSGKLHLTNFVADSTHLAGFEAVEGWFVSKIAAALLVLLCLSLFSLPGSAQLIPPGNVYAGVSYGEFTDAINQQSYKGWNGSLEDSPFVRFQQHLGLVLDGSGYYRSGVTEYDFFIGPRLFTNIGKWRPFVQAFGGGQRLNSSSNINFHYAIAFGGGADYKLPFKNFAWRVQGDFVHSHYFSANQNDYRVSTGVVWHF
jgi:hypothetical protein